MQETDDDGRDDQGDGSRHGQDPGPGVHTPGVTGGGQGHDGRAVPLRPGHQHHKLPGGLESQSPDVGGVLARDEIIVQSFSQTVNLKC